LQALDKIVELVGTAIEQPRVTYNKNHIALGTSGRNFCWFHPPKAASHCHVRVRTVADVREEQIRQFEETSLYVRPFQRELITLKLSGKDIATHKELILGLLRSCAAASLAAD
jgi:hypothetical protein